MPRRAGAGFVSLVGAGPGDPGLLTRKADRRIAEADVIVHDALVPLALLAGAAEGAEVLHRQQVGEGTQSDLNRFMIRQARRGRRVVRLKGGDPFVFGRGGEEAAALAEAGVDFEIVPGVSAGVAVAAYAGIPLTHRGISSDVTFVTGHEDPSKPDTSIDWNRIVRTGGTLVVFMGVRRLGQVVDRLLEAGAGIDTPACVIEWGTTPMQRIVEGALSDIVERAKQARVDHPAIVVIGRVVSLRHSLAWFDRRPLWGRRVLVTRAKEQAPALVQALRDKGAGVIALPVLAFTKPESEGFLHHAIDELREGDTYDWVLFTSANGARFLHRALWDRGLDLRVLGRCRVACIGPATAEALEERGIRADLIPAEFRAEGLLEALEAAGGIRGQRFLIPRAEVAREVLPDTLRAKGGIVDVVPTYRTIRPKTPWEVAQHHVRLADTVTFTSPSSVRNLLAMLGDGGRELLAERTLACIGPITSRALKAEGLEPQPIVARSYTADGLVEAIVDHALGRALQK